MKRKFSIHFEAGKKHAIMHDLQSYIYKELSDANECSCTDADKIYADILKAYKKRSQAYEVYSSKKMRSNVEYIREAVLSIDAHVTMDDLKKVAKYLFEKYQLECFLITIHRGV